MTLELFAKNTSAEPNEQTFGYSAVNGGYHTIIIKDKTRPLSPKAMPGEGSYTETQYVQLTAQEDCDIYYSLYGEEPQLYRDKITIDKTTTVTCYAQRRSNGKKSNTVRFEYKIIPKAPFMFIGDGEQKELVPNIYNHDKKFTVYVSDKDVFGDIAVGSEIYYTFSNVSAENITRADDPKTGWVMLDAQNKSIEITSKTTVRLVTKRLDEFSEVSRYQLGIKPAAPTASERTGEYNKKIKAALDCTTENTEIYYTTDGSDPRVSNTRLQAYDSLDSEKISIRKDTVVKAVVLKNGEKYSSVVTGTYEFVNKKPPKPIATLPQGRYTKKIGDDTRIETHFAEGSKVYYTISYEGKFEPDPIPNVAGIEYDGLAVEIKGHTIIKAVAVNNFGVKSDVAVFEYIAEPEAPRAAPSATIGKNRLPVVPVSAVVGSIVKYEVNGAENEIVCDSGKFYIDMQTGNAYADSECRQLLAESSANVSARAELKIKSELCGVESAQNSYTYKLSDEANVLAQPYAYTATGEYEEVSADDDGNLLYIRLYSLNSGDVIKYMLNNSGNWVDYEAGDVIKIKNDTILRVRSEKDGEYSTTASYVYTFVPLRRLLRLNREDIP